MRNPEEDYERDMARRSMLNFERGSCEGRNCELPPQKDKKEIWLDHLANFIVEANKNTWAADTGEVTPQKPGFKELEYSKGSWCLRDSYTGYFSAPGMTVIYYKDEPAWTMAYGGKGMEEDQCEHTKFTFKFLKSALMQITPEFPYRGPKHYESDLRSYDSSVKGDLINFIGSEAITRKGVLEFSQVFFGGIVIGKDSERQPIFPWDR